MKVTWHIIILITMAVATMSVKAKTESDFTGDLMHEQGDIMFEIDQLKTCNQVTLCAEKREAIRFWLQLFIERLTQALDDNDEDAPHTRETKAFMNYQLDWAGHSLEPLQK